jgi:hypothetical protein
MSRATRVLAWSFGSALVFGTFSRPEMPFRSN